MEHNQSKTLDWIQLLTSLSIVAGLALVIWELQQARDLAGAQVISDSFMQYSNLTAAQMSENLPLAMEKACTSPSAINERDLVALHGYYTALVDIPLKGYSISAQSSISSNWQRSAETELSIVFSNHIGRSWWRARMQTYPQELRQIGDGLLATLPKEPGACWLTPWQAEIDRGVE